MNISYQHSDLAAGRWFELPVEEQMGNIGSEFGRALNWKNKRNQDQMTKAMFRGLELFDLTLQDKRWNFCRLREIARAREVMCDYLVGDNEYKSDEKSLSNYFMGFALAARINK